MTPFPSFESLAHRLACIWLSGRMDDTLATQLQDLLAEAPAGEPREQLQALSEGWRAWRLSYLMQISDEPSLPAQLERAVGRARASAWPRAAVLARAGAALWAERTLSGAASHWAQQAEALQAEVAAMPADWPAVERCVCEVRLGELELQLARSESLLERVLRLEQLEFPAPLHEPMRGNVRQLLLVLLLEMGDLAGALMCSSALVDLVEQGPARSISLYYNHLLVLGLMERHAEAQAFIQARPFLRDAAYWREAPQAIGLLVWLDSQGSPVQSWPPWPALAGPLPAANGNPMSANLAWMQADLALRQGQPAQAVAVLEAYLAAVRASEGSSLSPLNGTMIFQTLSRAHEALGDSAAALEALRRAQAHAHAWTLRSTEARLKALHRASPGVGSEVQSRRVQALQAAGQARPVDPATRLLAHVSHEMRNPLQGVLGMITLLQMSGLDEAQRRQLRLADASARMALALCHDLLDLAKLDSGRLQIQATPCAVHELLVDVVHTWQPQAELKGITLRAELAPDLPSTMALDRLRVQQVLMNLLANAVKFTRQGQVRVAASWQRAAAAGSLRVEVHDTGIGIATHERERLFQEFAQANGRVAAEFGGTGLGLALCRKLVAAMGGRIDVLSTPGQGSCFWFELPA
jgi:signal transduction histidine kinase